LCDFLSIGNLSLLDSPALLTSSDFVAE
jgi:hypothetical protein